MMLAGAATAVEASSRGCSAGVPIVVAAANKPIRADVTAVAAASFVQNWLDYSTEINVVSLAGTSINVSDPSMATAECKAAFRDAVRCPRQSLATR